jgi:flagellar P-ring protein precursor FlgI
MRRKIIYIFCLALLGIGFSPNYLGAAIRIKDVASFEGVRVNQLVGYGLVVGLNGTGDRSQTYFSTQTLANMLERSGITINTGQVRVKNIAAVMVTADLPPFIRPGSQVDVTVSSIGDAQSIQGGVLIMTPLLAADNQVYVTAQGQVTLGGFSVGGSSNRVQLNHPTVGRIPNGGLVEKDAFVNFNGKSRLNLVLNQSDFTTATRTVRAINESTIPGIASALDGRTIAIEVPANYSQRIVEFISMIENAKIEVDSPARVLMNEKTGTIIIGKEVKISEVSIIHGSLSLQIGTSYLVSQPESFGRGDTTVVPEKTINVQENENRTVMLHEGASVEEVVRALTTIGAGPRDVIAILQAIKAQGALQAELEII